MYSTSAYAHLTGHSHALLGCGVAHLTKPSSWDVVNFQLSFSGPENHEKWHSGL